LKMIFRLKLLDYSMCIDLQSQTFLPKLHFLDILKIFRLDMGQISYNLLKTTFAT